jgi:hypothetical protein
MLSECARVTTAEEARFRVDYPNSLPRRIKVIALDPSAERQLHCLAQKAWNAAGFMTVARDMPSSSMHDWLRTLRGDALNLLEQVKSADAVVTISTAGENAEDAAVVAEACHLNNVMLTSLVLDTGAVSEAALLQTLVPLRAQASMVVIAKGEDYVEAMLIALRA